MLEAPHHLLSEIVGNEAITKNISTQRFKSWESPQLYNYCKSFFSCHLSQPMPYSSTLYFTHPNIKKTIFIDTIKLLWVVGTSFFFFVPGDSFVL